MNQFDFLYSFDLFGTAVFAVSGALAAGHKRMDIFGGAVLGTVTAIGGGSLRDMLLDHPVFWTINPHYLHVAVFSSIIAYIAARVFTIPRNVLLVCDSIGLATVTVIGAAKALGFSDSFMIAIVMGCITGVAGGMIRDVLSGEVPLVLRREVYATAALLGASVYVIMAKCELSLFLCIAVGAGVTLACRFAAIFFGWSLPVLKSRGNAASGQIASKRKSKKIGRIKTFRD